MLSIPEWTKQMFSATNLQIFDLTRCHPVCTPLGLSAHSFGLAMSNHLGRGFVVSAPPCCLELRWSAARLQRTRTCLSIRVLARPLSRLQECVCVCDFTSHLSLNSLIPPTTLHVPKDLSYTLQFLHEGLRPRKRVVRHPY